MGDSLREIRTMILLALPYPPLPVSVAHVEADECRVDGEESVTTSHTLIGQCLNGAVARADERGNRGRQARQRAALQRFLHSMATAGFFGTAQDVFGIYCGATLEHVASFFPEGHPLDLRFRPMDSVCRGDATHRKMAEYLAGQSVLFQDQPPVGRDQYLLLSYPEQLLLARSRLGHAMTPEEQAALAGHETD